MAIRLLGILLSALSFITHTDCQVDSSYLNTELDECLQLISNSTGGANYPNSTGTTFTDLETIEMQSTCLQEFVWKFGGVKWSDFNITEHDVRFINDLTRSLVKEHHRVRRQAGPIGGPRRIYPSTGFRIRREYRRLTDRDRFFLHEAINVMKRRGEYDTFANLHQGVVVTSAHGGPNFFGWHRVYLALVEEALRRINRRVALAYWDSSLDFHMENPVNSIIWSPPFLGNGDGFVTTGPFANWQTPVGPLARDIGAASRLISRPVIRDILTRCRTAEISRPTAQARYNLELAHGGPHVWVGGQMSGLNTAAHEPTFFLHHAFIDYLWELFRIRQARRCRVNPVTDYPSAAAEHDRNRPMDAFPQYRNIDGYQAFWTEFWYRYEQSPTCSFFRRSCGTPYLRCDVFRRRCVSVARRRTERDGPPVGGAGGAVAFGAQSPVQASRAAAQAGSINVGPKFQAPPPEIRSRDSRMMMGKRKKRQADNSSNSATQITDFGNGFMAPSSDGRTSDALGYNIAGGVPTNDPMVAEPENPRQSLFPFAMPMPLIPLPQYPKMSQDPLDNMLGLPDNGGANAIDDTVFIPVKVFYKRPTTASNTVSSRLRCQMANNGAMQVNVRAQGLNYMGIHDDYAVIDARHETSTAMVYMAVKLPVNTTSEVLLTAVDGCGRLCQARCLDRKYAVRTFRKCNGILHVDRKATFGMSRREAVGTVLRDYRQGIADTSRNVDMQFLCPMNGQTKLGFNSMRMNQ